MIKLLLLALLLLFFTACQQASKLLHETLVHTLHDVSSEHHALEHCRLNQAMQIVGKNESPLLRNAEWGLLSFYRRDYSASQKYFQTAIDLYRKCENRPVIALSKYVIADYDGEGYDKVLLHNYNALNFLFMANLEDARVETRNADFIQRKERRKFYDKIKGYAQKSKKYSNVLNSYDLLFAHVNPSHNPYQNPFAFYLSALLYEEAGKFDEALIDIDHALEFDKKSLLLAEKRAFYQSGQRQKRRRIELFFDIGKSPVKTEEKIPVKVSEREERLYLPSYVLYISDIDKIVLCDASGKRVATASTLCDINAIKINAFKKELPLILEKIISEVAKEAAADTIAQKSSLVAPFYQMFKVIYSQNNQLSWVTLPQKIDVLSFVPRKGETYTLKAIDKNGKILDTKKLELSCSGKLKNCYGHYLLKNDKFCKLQ